MPQIHTRIVEILEKTENTEIKLRRLNLGDYIINEKVYVERKTVADFGLSLIDGRLFSQVSRLCESRRPALLIIEGSQMDWEKIKISRSALLGAMVTITVVFGIPWLHSGSKEETAQLLIYASKQISRQGGNYVKRQFPKRKKNRQIAILASLPGIGRDRASRLMDHFGSISAVMNADVKMLCEVEGIGKKTANGIVELVQAD